MLEIMSGISAALHAHDYDLLVIQVVRDDTDWARRYLETGRVDGFILLSATCTPAHRRRSLEMKAPFVIWGTPPGNHGYCSVSGDSFAGGRIATEHLLASGESRIAFLGGPPRGTRSRTATRATRPLCAKPAKTSTRRWSPTATTPPPRRAAAMRALLERRPTSTRSSSTAT